MPGNLFVVAAPSGTGKTTLVKALVESTPNIMVSISHTTRTQRPAETHGVNYYFVPKNEFQNMITHHDFLEHALVFNNLYGTSRKWVEETLKKGTDVVLEIDWQGCQQIKKLMPECVSIFILPPSRDALADRLINRNQDSAEVIEQRLADVRETSTHIREYDYIVVNDVFEKAVEDTRAIVHAARLRKSCQMIKLAKLISSLCDIHS